MYVKYAVVLLAKHDNFLGDRSWSIGHVAKHAKTLRGESFLEGIISTQNLHRKEFGTR